MKFAGVDENDFVAVQLEHDQEGDPEGPYTYHPLAAFISIRRPSTTAALMWNNATPIWVETASLNEMSVIKNTEINVARLAANRSYFLFHGKQIACDELSRSDIDAVSGVVSLLGVVPVSRWKTVDNTYVAIPDKAAWIQFYMAMVTTGQSNFDHAQDLKSQLAAATTPAQIEAIKWS